MHFFEICGSITIVGEFSVLRVCVKGVIRMPPLTPEQRRHQEEYYAAKRRYVSADEKRQILQNKIIGIQNDRPKLINKMNELESERKRNSEALEEISKTNSSDGDFEDSMKDSAGKLETAAQGFLAIGTSSVAELKDLTEVFSHTDIQTKNSMDSVFENIKNIKNAISNKISDLITEYNKAENELQQSYENERRYNEEIYTQKKIMENAEWDMAYHKRFFQ